MVSNSPFWNGTPRSPVLTAKSFITYETKKEEHNAMDMSAKFRTHSIIVTSTVQVFYI